MPKPIPAVLMLWERIRSSLWFIPAAMSLGAVLLTWLALQIDIGLAPDRAVWWLHSGNASDASDLLQTLLGSLLTMTTLAISITIVVLTLAAGQLGPRVIRSFVSDRRTQIPLGLFVGTIVYTVLVLRLIHAGMAESDVPNVAVTLATTLFLASVATLLFFVHHLSRSIVADVIIARVGDRLDAALIAMLPATTSDEEVPLRADGNLAVVTHDTGGYVQAVDYAALVQAARRQGALIQILASPGHHLLPGAPAAAGSAAVMARITADVRGAIVTGPERTPVQDLEFSVRQLVEIALRALSPGINDPFTAVTVVDRLSRSLVLALERGSPQRVWRDADGIPRVVAPAGSTGIVHAAFHEIALAASGSRMVMQSLAEAFQGLALQARNPEHTKAIAAQISLAERAAERGLADETDREALKAAYGIARTNLVMGRSAEPGPGSGSG